MFSLVYAHVFIDKQMLLTFLESYFREKGYTMFRIILKSVEMTLKKQLRIFFADPLEIEIEIFEINYPTQE